MKTFTPGPWKVSTSAVYDQVNAADESLICFAAMKENSKANARLIAAAPDLLDALQAALEFIEDYREGVIKGTISGAGILSGDYNICKNARAALAKANGEDNGRNRTARWR